MAYGDGQEPELLVMISFDFYIVIMPHILATDVAVIGTVCVHQQEANAGVDCHGYHTVNHRGGISSGGNTSWVKNCGGWSKDILGLLHPCHFGLSPICDGHTYCSWGSFVVIGSHSSLLLPLFVLGLIFSFWS